MAVFFPLLAGMKDVHFLEEEHFNGASEQSIPKHQRWKVWEDKTLLRMFYEDMGIHAIKKRLNRTYLSVRTRTKAITLPEDVLKGREFEDFVLELFDLSESSAYSLIDWRGDKTMGNISPANNGYPDFLIEYRKGKTKLYFSVECKWRAFFSRHPNKPLLTPEQLKRYQSYADDKRQRVTIVLGIGGEPSMPEELYLIPIEAFQQVKLSPSSIQKYKRQELNKHFTLEEFYKDE